MPVYVKARKQLGLQQCYGFYKHLARTVNQNYSLHTSYIHTICKSEKKMFHLPILHRGGIICQCHTTLEKEINREMHTLKG